MVYFFSALIVLLLVSGFYFRNYERSQLKEQKKKNIFTPFLPVGLWLFDQILKKNSGFRQKQKEWATAVYIREDPQIQLRLRGARQLAILWVCLFCAGVAGIAVSFLPEDRTQSTSLERPEFGETQSYSLIVEGLETEPQEITVEIDGQEPSGEGMQSVFNEAYVSIQQEMLGENLSLQEVRSNLTLPSSTIYGIRVTWTSLNPELIDDYGAIVAETIPEEGVLANLQAKLSYSMYSYYYELTVRIMPPEKDRQYFMSVLQKAINDSNNSSKEEKMVALPDEIEGRQITFLTEKRQPLKFLPLLFLLLSVVVCIVEQQKKKEAYEKRNKQLLRDYPEFVLELGLMIQCGLTIRAAWNRLAADYENRRSKCAGSKRFLYEEMIVTRNHIEAGASEAAAYGAFGRRCKLLCYIRLGSNLEQNMKQGISGLVGMLDQELTQALELRRNQALKAGEHMETMMLIPMSVLLGLVMAILIIPAFMNM